MRYPLGLVFDSAKHLLAGKSWGKSKFAISVSLDPLGRGGRGTSTTDSIAKAGSPVAARPMLTVRQCLAALEECPSPIVRIDGHEPLEYPDLQMLCREILSRGKHLFLSTDGALIRRRLHMIPPDTTFFWTVNLDGTESVHDARAERPGLFAEAFDGIKAAKNAGFFVVVSTTIHPDTSVADLQQLYRKLHAAHVDGYQFSPAYTRTDGCRAESAEFRRQIQDRFREISDALREYNLMISPVYLEYLRGERELGCAAWANPVYGPEGWSGPCYLSNKGHANSYAQLREVTACENHERGLNLDGETCQSSPGVESAAIVGRNRKAGDLWKMLAWPFGGNLGQKRERMGGS